VLFGCFLDSFISVAAGNSNAQSGKAFAQTLRIQSDTKKTMIAPELMNAKLIEAFNKQIQREGLDVRSEISHLDGLNREDARTPALITQIKGESGLVEFFQQPMFLFRKGANHTYEEGKVPHAPMDIFSFSVTPSIMCWTDGGRNVEIDFQYTPLGELDDYAGNMAKSLGDTALGNPTEYNYGLTKKRSYDFNSYPNKSLMVDESLTGRVIDAFNSMLPAKGIAISNECYIDPRYGVPNFRTFLKGKFGKINVSQSYIAEITPIKRHEAGAIQTFPADKMKLGTYPFIYLEWAGKNKETIFVSPNWRRGPTNEINSSTLKFSDYKDMAEQLLTYVIGKAPEPAEVQYALPL
jgi:hypothetical protein